MKKINKTKLYNALAQHYIAFPDEGEAWTVESRIDWILAQQIIVDAKVAEVEAALPEEEAPPENEAAVLLSESVNAWLLALKVTDREEFERVRVLSFADQVKESGL